MSVKNSTQNPELGFVWLLKRIKQHSKMLLALSSAYIIFGIAYLLIADRWYQAEVVLVPTERGMAGVATNQIGGLAALAGINVSGGSNRSEAVALLKSKELLRTFIDRNSLVDTLLSGKDVNESADPLDVAVVYFNKSLRSVSEDRRAGTVTLAISWSNAELAADWANGLVLDANEQLRLRALKDATRNVEFLREEIVRTKLTTLQQSLARLLESELQTVLLAQNGDGFGFRVVDRARAPARAYWPQPAIVILIALVLSLISVAIWIALKEER